MKTIEVSEDINNLAELLTNDSIGRNGHIISFIKLLCSIENKAVIALDGSWGSGKTVFSKQVKIVLDSMNTTSQIYNSDIADNIRKVWPSKIGDCFENLSSFSTVYYDAWMHDNSDDPVLSLVYEIMKTGAGDKIGYNVDWTKTLALIGEEITGLNISRIIKEIRGKDYFENIKEKEGIDIIVSNFLNSLMVERGNKLVVFIDELDRCSPLFAVKLLERVKHFFNHDNVIFVFSTNISELECVIKNCYGVDYNSSRYLDRFFDVRISLPQIDLKQYFNFIGMARQGNLREAIEEQLIKDMKMEMREINKYILISKWAAYESTEGSSTRGDLSLDSNQSAKIIVFSVVLPIAIGLRMIDEHKYIDFISGNDSACLHKILAHEPLSCWVGELLLNLNESYGDEGKQMVRFDDRIEEVYNAIFNFDYGYTMNDFQCTVGKAKFSGQLTEELRCALGLMSKYSLIT